MSRKYRQRGYMDYDSGPGQKHRSKDRKERREYDGPRGRSASPMFKTFKCERCGTTFPEISTRPIAIERILEVGIFSIKRFHLNDKKPQINKTKPIISKIRK